MQSRKHLAPDCNTTVARCLVLDATAHRLYIIGPVADPIGVVGFRPCREPAPSLVVEFASEGPSGRSFFQDFGSAVGADFDFQGRLKPNARFPTKTLEMLMPIVMPLPAQPSVPTARNPPAVSPESDRRTVELVTAILSDRLAELLRAFFRNDQDAVARLLDPSGPLSTFQAQVTLAKVLGLLGPQLHGYLQAFADMRLAYDREAGPLALSAPTFQPMLRALHDLTQAQGAGPPRIQERLLMGCTILDDRLRCLAAAHH